MTQGSAPAEALERVSRLPKSNAGQFNGALWAIGFSPDVNAPRLGSPFAQQRRAHPAMADGHRLLWSAWSTRVFAGGGRGGLSS